MVGGNMKHCLVLGSSGFIGSHLSSQLYGQYNIIGYCSPNDKGKVNVPFETIYRDFTNEKDFDSILKKYNIDTVFYLISSGIPKEGTFYISQELNDSLFPTVRLLEAMTKAGTQRIIFASSGGTVYGESNGSSHKENEMLSPICGYGVQKAILEKIFRLYEHEHGIHCYIARISNVYGYDKKKDKMQGIIPILLRKSFSGQEIELYGNTIRDYVYIDDVVHALICLGEYSGKERIFNIASGEPISLDELVQSIETVTGRKFCGIKRQPIRSCDVTVNTLNIQRAISELNWQPKIMLNTGLRLLMQELKPEFI